MRRRRPFPSPLSQVTLGKAGMSGGCSLVPRCSVKGPTGSLGISPTRPPARPPGTAWGAQGLTRRRRPAGGEQAAKGGMGAEQGELLAEGLENHSCFRLGGQWRHRARANLGSSRQTPPKCSPAHLSRPLSPGALPSPTSHSY